MKAWKIISGILSILLAFVLAVIAFMHLFATAIASVPFMGYFGFFGAFMLFLAGLISLCTCGGYLAGNISTLIFFLLSAGTSYYGLSEHPYLLVSLIWSIVCAVIIFILCFFSRKRKRVEPARTAPIYVSQQYYGAQPPQNGQYYQQAPQQQAPQNGQYYPPQQPAQQQAPQYQQPAQQQPAQQQPVPPQYPPQGGQGQ